MNPPVPILYEDGDVLVINKPSGLLTHEDGRTDEPTLVRWLLENRPEVAGVGDAKFGGARLKDGTAVRTEPHGTASQRQPRHEAPAERDGIVHRLDRGTSGVMLVAKTQRAFVRLTKQFKRREIRKDYHAFVYGRVKNDEGMIDRPIARARRNPLLRSATRGKRGREREAVTEYRVLARCREPETRGGLWYSFLELAPRTGRTHQLRVHLKAINHPVVCDKLYAPKRECAFGFSRLALHSRSISFKHPTSGAPVAVEAPYPDDFQHALRDIEKCRR